MVGRDPSVNFNDAAPDDGPDQNGYINQHGLGRKVFVIIMSFEAPLTIYYSTYLKASNIV